MTAPPRLLAIVPATCDGCPAWRAPLSRAVLLPGACLQRTTFMSQDCLARQQPDLNARPRGDGAGFDSDPNWRD